MQITLGRGGLGPAVTGPPAPCQPMPGPPGAAWPAKPGVTYCWPYPQCCAPQHPAATVARHASAGFLHWLPVPLAWACTCAALTCLAIVVALRMYRRYRAAGHAARQAREHTARHSRQPEGNRPR